MHYSPLLYNTVQYCRVESKSVEEFRNILVSSADVVTEEKERAVGKRKESKLRSDLKATLWTEKAYNVDFQLFKLLSFILSHFICFFLNTILLNNFYFFRLDFFF